MRQADWVAVVAAIALFFVTVALFWLIRDRSRWQQERLRRRLLGVPDEDEAAEGVRIRIRRIGTGSEARLARLEVSLQRAGVKMPAARFALQVALALALAAPLLWLVAGSLAGAAVLWLVVLCSPLVYLRWLVARRERDLQRQVPRALEITMIGLRAGQPLERALKLAAEEVAEPLASELRRCNEEYTLGRPIEESLRRLSGRWPRVRSLRSFSEATSVLKRAGGNLIRVLETLVAEIHGQEAYEAKHRALTAQGRFAGMVLMLIPGLALGLQLLLAPEKMAALFGRPAGQVMLSLAAAFWLVGSLWVIHLVRPRA